jgi:hypothetical protein
MYANFNKEKKREENTMKYETPKLTVLTPAIDAIQSDGGLPKFGPETVDSLHMETSSAYTDWE